MEVLLACHAGVAGPELRTLLQWRGPGQGATWGWAWRRRGGQAAARGLLADHRSCQSKPQGYWHQDFARMSSNRCQWECLLKDSGCRVGVNPAASQGGLERCQDRCQCALAW